ncbi:MAG: hypothetical protein JWP21_2250 [Tardiphaga sp.]|nr:hypothetical protein [Tardiphaga sp.]MDB5573654.1 hypothetical protein [Tardiphaga sp.]
MIGAGQLRSRLTLQKPLDVADGQGGFTRGYADVAEVWAQVTLLASRETVAADADGASTRARIVLRGPLDLTLRHRLVEDDDVYRITGIRDDGAWIAIDAELRVA